MQLRDCISVLDVTGWFFMLLKHVNSTGVFQVLSNDNSSFGYNAATGIYEDLMAAGIIDPTKVCIVNQLQIVIVFAKPFQSL